MRNVSLSQKLLWASGAIFILFFLCSILVFYRGQTRLTAQEMDRLLQSEALTMSSLVNIDQRGEIDFEFSNQFLNQYESLKFSTFFRLFPIDSQKVLRESTGAPQVACDLKQGSRYERIDHKNYRISSTDFAVSSEEEQSIPPGFTHPRLCLVMGIDATPYQDLVIKTIYSTLPFLFAIFGISILLLHALIRMLTGDLSALTRSLESADFGSTRSFPKLPVSKTREVTAIVEKLEALHHQAAQVYDEMLLFMARAAHQLKTPVASIQATYDVLVRRDRSKEELLEGLSDIDLGIKQMSQLTLKLITSTRINFESAPQLKSINLGIFFEKEWKLFHYQAMIKEIECEMEALGSSMVQADEYLLTEIFGNIIENAILYSPHRSKIRISWLKSLKDNATIVTIRDEGPGFPIEVQNHLFEPFFRGDERKVGGSGLGLSIVKRAVVSIGGAVHLLESGPKGSVMQVILQSTVT